MAAGGEVKSSCAWFSDFSEEWSTNFDRTFYWLGKRIGSRPWRFLLLSLTICVVSSLGLILWREEVDEVELFMPRDAPIRKHAAWVEDNFRDDLRFESIIVEGDNVLDKAVLLAIAEMELAIRGIVVSGHNWSEVCARYLTWFPNVNESNAIAEISQFMTDFKDNCIYQSILRIWTTEGEMDSITKLDQKNVLHDITEAMKEKQTKGKAMTALENIKPLLSGVTRSNNGAVTGAKATILNWILKKSNRWSPDWELEFIENVLFSNRTLPPGIKVYAVSTRSYDDFLHQVLQNNMTVFFAGFTLIILYAVVMLGRFNAIEQRVYLSLLGVSVVGQAILASYGVCFYVGLFWGPVHPILPFLLLGIGVDNTFVIMQCLDNLKKEDSSVSVPVRIGRTLRQAGVSITVTSLTDILAFAIGTSTVMPFLRSFCIFAALGIFFMYVFGIFFFVSCLAIDEKRIDQQREGCCCRVQRNWKPNECSQRNIQKMIFTEYLGPTLMKKPVKMCVLLVSPLLFLLNIHFLMQTEQKFDPMWYLNPESYPLKFNNKLNEHFPEYGKRAGVYLGSGINYYEDKEKLYELYNGLKDSPYINKHTLDFWYISFQDWLSEAEYASEVTDEDSLKSYLFEFLMMPNGQKYVKDIKFSTFPFNEYNITASQLQIQHIVMNTTNEQFQAMQSLQNIIRSVNFSADDVVSYSQQYISWSANKIIAEELYRNLGLTILAVAIVTLVLIQNLRTSVCVICCVVFTVFDLMGSMYWLGLTVEISTSIMVLLCAGLAVDYSAHIGNEFTRLQGTKDERAVQSLGMIGSAVFNGGLSTFLAFVLLAGSQSYLFTTFFKLFTGVVVFGLFHSLIFLPVALSWFGPEARTISRTNTTNRIEAHPLGDGCLQRFLSKLKGKSEKTEPLRLDSTKTSERDSAVENGIIANCDNTS